MRILSVCVTSLLLLLSGAAAAAQTPVSESSVSAPAAAAATQNIKRSSSDEIVHQGNLQRTGVYPSKAVVQLNKSEPLSPRLFKLNGARVESWGDWYNFGGRSVYLGGSYQLPTSINISVPLFANDIIYFKVDHYFNWESFLYAVDAQTGQLKWKFKAVKGFVSLPTVAEGVLYVGVGDSLFYAVDPLTQKVKWKSSSGDNSFVVTSPVVAGGKVFFGSDNSIFYALDILTGKTLWEYMTRAGNSCAKFRWFPATRSTSALMKATCLP